MLPHKAINLTKTSLMEFVRSQKGQELRNIMSTCDKHCGWYQYFATSSYTSVADAYGTIRPYFAELLGKMPKPKTNIERLPKIGVNTKPNE